MSIFYSKCKDNETGLLKESKDQNYLQIESLPNEIIVCIFSYLDKKEIRKVSMVNKRWFQVANYEIDSLLIKWPKQQNQDFQTLINRFPRLKNIELATKITNKDSYIRSFLDSFEFDGTLEFDIDPNLMRTKDPGTPAYTSIKRIRINPAKKEKGLEYKESKIINVEIDLPYPQDFNLVLEEILSMDNVSKITYSAVILEGYDPQEYINFVKIIESIFSRPYLKQIDFDVLLNVDLDIVTAFPKNFNVEEVNFNMGFKPEVCKKVFDALPNLKKVKVVIFDNFEHLPLILKNISVLKNLKSLNVAICSCHEDEKIDEQKLRDCLERSNCCDVIKDSFPMNAEVFIADLDLYHDDEILTNLIIKEAGKEPDIVIGHNVFV